jgi:hypothetical protein
MANGGGKWTNGPWTQGAPSGHNACTIYDADGEAVCMVYGIPMHTKVSEVPERYADVMRKAALLRAAPELAEALQLALRLIQTPNPDCDECEAVVGRIEAALSKAGAEAKAGAEEGAL